VNQNADCQEITKFKKTKLRKVANVEKPVENSGELTAYKIMFFREQIMEVTIKAPNSNEAYRIFKSGHYDEHRAEPAANSEKTEEFIGLSIKV
jgi:hypothetical protein